MLVKLTPVVVVVAVVQYPQLVLSSGLRIVLVIGLSTVLVMAVTSLVVDRCYRLELMLRRRGSNRKAQLKAEVHGA